jgi:hypothetical protein
LTPSVEISERARAELKQLEKQGYSWDVAPDGKRAMVYMVKGNAAVDQVNLIEPEVGMYVEHASGLARGKVVEITPGSTFTHEPRHKDLWVLLDDGGDWLEWRWCGIVETKDGAA